MLYDSAALSLTVVTDIYFWTPVLPLKSPTQQLNKGFSNRDITISYLYMNAPLNVFNELSMSKR